MFIPSKMMKIPESQGNTKLRKNMRGLRDQNSPGNIIYWGLEKRTGGLRIQKF